ncbi:MAG: hypothetical protein LBE91_10175 [Tannerella sp.]|nr:hypothetical protein [Tannerella sp.]
MESAVNTGIDGSVLLEYSTEEIFFYDSRDSLERKESYEINADGEKILFAMEIYSDTTIQIVHFDAYKDTVFYNYRKKDQDGHIVEEYEFSRKPGISIVERELKVTSKYENGELKCSIFNDLTNKTNSVFRYEYKLEGDTVFTFEYENDQLVKKSRKSNSLNGNEIEINEFFNIGGVDSTFYYKNMVIRRIYRYSNRCTESTYEYDIPTYRSKMMLKSSVLLINTTFAANQSI